MCKLALQPSALTRKRIYEATHTAGAEGFLGYIVGLINYFG